MVAVMGLICSLEDLILSAFPLEAAYTEEKSGASFPTEVATSAFLNALKRQQRLIGED